MTRNIRQYGIPYSQRGRYSNYSSSSTTAGTAGTTGYTVSCQSADTNAGSVKLISTTAVAPDPTSGVEPEVVIADRGGSKASKTFPRGTVMKATAIPNSGYRFVKWTTNITGAANVTRNPYTFEVAQNTSLVAHFEPVFTSGGTGSSGGTITHTVKAAPNNPSYGAVRGVTNGIAVVNDGDTITLTAVPKSGYKFVSWSGGAFSTSRTGETITLKVTSDITLVAVFAPIDNTTPGTGSGNEEHGTGNGGNVIGNEGPDTDVEVGSSDQAPGTIVNQAKVFLKKWWWAVLIVGYIVYKNRKGGK